MNDAPSTPVTLTASEDLTAYRFVKIGSSAQTVDAIDAVTDLALGVVVDDVDFSEATAASVWLLNRGGILPVEAAAAISLGANIAPSANGRAQTAVSTQYTRGIALEAASGAGHVIDMLVEIRETVIA